MRAFHFLHSNALVLADMLDPEPRGKRHWFPSSSIYRRTLLRGNLSTLVQVTFWLFKTNITSAREATALTLPNNVSLPYHCVTALPLYHCSTTVSLLYHCVTALPLCYCPKCRSLHVSPGRLEAVQDSGVCLESHAILPQDGVVRGVVARRNSNFLQHQKVCLDLSFDDSFFNCSSSFLGNRDF